MQASQNEVINSLTVLNTEPASGGDDEETAEQEVKLAKEKLRKILLNTNNTTF